MSKFKSAKLVTAAIGLCLIVFGQNCSKAFQAIDNVEVSSLKSGDPAPSTVGLSDAERVGLKGRIAADDFAFPLNAQSTKVFPTKLSDTKLFKNLETLEGASGLIPFEVNAPLWSDAALKRRWYALPEGSEKIVFSESGNWMFPVGTILVKHFELQVNPNLVRRLETRVFLYETAGWKGYSYKWNELQTDADLLPPEGAVETYTVVDGINTRQQTWNYPTQAQCIGCHSNSGFVLGLRTLQTNKLVRYGSANVEINQLKVMKDLKLISDGVPDPTTLKAYPRFDNASIDVGLRARAYLAVNCSTCHSGAAPPAGVKFSYSLALADLNILNFAANNAMGLGMGAKRLVPHDKENSTLYLRMMSTDPANRMPKVGSNLVDPQGTALIAQWIDSL